MKFIITFLICAFFGGLLIIQAEAGEGKRTLQGTHAEAPDAGYGEKKPVRSLKEARKVLGEYSGKKGLKTGEIREKELYFQAELLDEEGKTVDKVILDKRTGRIRSIY